MKIREQPGLGRYGLAVVWTVAAVWVTVTWTPATARPYTAPLAAIILSAWFAGFRPALASLALSALAVNIHLARTQPAWGVADLVRTALFAGIALLVAAFARARESSEREARRQNAHLEAMFGQAAMGISYLSLDGRLQRVNQRMADIIGRTIDAAVGLTCEQITHREDWPSHATLIDQVARGELKEIAIDKRYLRPDGSPVWVHVSMARLLDETGRVEGLIAIVEDITERHEAEDRLRASENRYRSLVDASSAIVWRSDATGAFTSQQESWQASTGQDVTRYSGWGWADAIHPDDRDHVQALWADTLANPRPVDTEVRIWNEPTQSYRWYSSRAVPRRSAGGDVEEWVGACTDIHERRLAEIQLRDSEERAQQALGIARQADREKDDFLALLAHELRNPLAPIRTAVQLLKMRQQPDAEDHRLHGVIDRQVQHLVRMVDDLLDVSRVLRGKVELRREPIDIADAIAIAAETSRPLIDTQRQQLKLDLPGRAVAVHGDAVRLSQVIANLLNNASKYSPGGAAIHLTASEADGEVVIQVCDSGAGIPGDVLARVFEPFVQADRSLERSRGGLGIGLTLVKKIVEMHNGEVSAESAGLGQGSVFTIRLPAYAGAAASASATEPQPAVAPPSRVLVVDDNVDAAESLAMLLQSDGHTVSVAHNGVDAVHRAEVWQPDIAVLDVGLPGMNGYEVASALRQRGENCPELIAVTGYGQAADTKRAFEAGFRFHLVKPVDARDLTAAIAQCAVNRQSRRANA